MEVDHQLRRVASVQVLQLSSVTHEVESKSNNQSINQSDNLYRPSSNLIQRIKYIIA